MSGAEGDLWQNICDDLETLAVLHDSEPSRELIEELRQHPIQEWLGLRLSRSTGAKLLDQALTDLPQPLDDDSLHRLAADFADIYLVHAYRASPCESPWLDKDQLVCQEPMFEVRDWYRHYGLAAENWRQRADDHIVLELRFVAHLAGLGTHEALIDLGRFLDQHMLRWVPLFAGRVAQRCRMAYFAGVAVLTGDYLDELRDVVADATGQPRMVIEPTQDRAPDSDENVAYLPGVGPGW